MSVEQEVWQRTEARFEEMRPFGKAPKVELGKAVLPPGLRWPAVAQTVSLLRFRHTFIPWMSRRFGGAFTLRVAPTGNPLAIFTGPDAAREIFAGDPAVFHAGKANAILGPVMGAHSVLLLDGLEHKRARKLLMPAFSAAALKQYEGVVTEVARAEVATWPVGSTFGAHSRMNALTLEVILRVVFGVTDETRLAALRPLVNATVDVSPGILLGWAIPRLRTLGPWRAAADTQRKLDQLIYAEIRERRTHPDLAERTDVLSRLIRVDDAGDRLTDDELRDELVTLLLAGHETTATALAWALYELGRDPALRAQARTASDAGDEAWFEAVLKESMRLRPVIPMVVRTLQQPATVGGFAFPAGATVGPSIILTHDRDKEFPAPEEFRPERFLGQSPPVNSWIPFGGGARRCIGAGFALMEGVAVLREVFKAWDIEAVGEEKAKVRNITSVPRNGVMVRVRPAR